MGDTNKTADTVTRTAQYQCRYKVWGEWGEISREEPISIKVIPGEKPQKTEDRFIAAANLILPHVSKKMLSCHGHRFVGFLPSAKEALASRSKAQTCEQMGPRGPQSCVNITEEQAKPKPVDKCLGEWATRSVCYR